VVKANPDPHAPKEEPETALAASDGGEAPSGLASSTAMVRLESRFWEVEFWVDVTAVKRMGDPTRSPVLTSGRKPCAYFTFE
jgi:hypothetical protein